MLEKYTNHDLIILNPEISNKQELFHAITEHLLQKGYIDSYHRFHKALHKREQAANTAILPHIAIPHAGCTSVDRLFLLIVISNKGINYESPTFDPINIVFLFGCDNQHNKDYLRLLAKSARLLKNPIFAERVISATSVNEILKTIKEFDHDLEEEQTTENYLLTITLFNKQKLPDLLTALLDVGIHNAEVLNSTSMARKIAFQIPVFAGLSIKSSKNNTESAVIMSNITDKKIPNRLFAILKELNLDFSEPGIGFMQLLKTNIVVGDIDEFS